MFEHLARQLHARPGRPADPGPASPGPDGLRRAAVAAVLRPGGELLFIRRAEREGDPWSGHMAFPGGRVDPGDPTPQAAAERETWEEVGVDLPRAGRLLGTLDELTTPMQRGPAAMVISPFVYVLHADPVLAPNHEVAAVHWISVERLIAGEGAGRFPLSWRGQTWQMPCVDLDGVRIWGLTLRMLDGLLAHLGAPARPWPSLDRAGEGR